jgi:hypothetical protein
MATGAQVSRWLHGAAMTALGIVLALVPPALWIAWTETILFWVAAIGAISAAALVVLAELGRDDVGDGPGPHAIASRERADASIAALHRIFPLTYHHSMVEKTRFRDAMDKVRQLLR